MIFLETVTDIVQDDRFDLCSGKLLPNAVGIKVVVVYVFDMELVLYHRPSRQYSHMEILF